MDKITPLEVEIHIQGKWGGERETKLKCPNEFAIAQKVNEIIDWINKKESNDAS